MVRARLCRALMTIQSENLIALHIGLANAELEMQGTALRVLWILRLLSSIDLVPAWKARIFSSHLVHALITSSILREVPFACKHYACLLVSFWMTPPPFASGSISTPKAASISNGKAHSHHMLSQKQEETMTTFSSLLCALIEVFVSVDSVESFPRNIRLKRASSTPSVYAATFESSIGLSLGLDMIVQNVNTNDSPAKLAGVRVNDVLIRVKVPSVASDLATDAEGFVDVSSIDGRRVQRLIVEGGRPITLEFRRLGAVSSPHADITLASVMSTQSWFFK